MSYICEQCNKEVIESYGSGRFCSLICAKTFSSKVAALKKRMTKDKKVEITTMSDIPINVSSADQIIETVSKPSSCNIVFNKAKEQLKPKTYSFYPKHQRKDIQPFPIQKPKTIPQSIKPAPSYKTRVRSNSLQEIALKIQDNFAVSVLRMPEEHIEKMINIMARSINFRS
jgi:hypothetical protein